MKLTPLDIHHKEFRTSLRGYNAEQVDAFLDEVADEFERLFKENIDLSEKLEAANDKVRSYAEIEKTLHNTMLAAQSSAEDIQARAANEADVVLRDAEMKAKELIQGALAEKQRAQAETMRLQALQDEFRAKFRATLEGFLKSANQTPAGSEAAVAETLVEPQVPAPSAVVAEDEDEFAPPAFMRVTQAEPVAAPASRPIPPFAPDLAAAEAAEAPSRPQARAGRRLDSTQPMNMDQPPSSGFVQSLTLGEMEGPDVRPETPVFDEPGEFTVGGRAPVGERDDDVDIEEID